jgi:hypothetical protein
MVGRSEKFRVGQGVGRVFTDLIHPGHGARSNVRLANAPPHTKRSAVTHFLFANYCIECKCWVVTF